ncbi:hypothetical protein B296_00051720 [Ensete ventricosum]|uniref:Uncharacterized protein n=1 Tax=Ensete ventricosum TaxID=4639 RepID=A0A426WZA7_ENSVE|nr:hypothetical protein B296_00051720 [Ensete ventricosum]
MTGGCIIVEATTINNTELLLPSRASFVCSLSRAGDNLKSFRSCLKWMCFDQSNAKHTMVSWSLFLISVFVPIVSHFVISA